MNVALEADLASFYGKEIAWARYIDNIMRIDRFIAKLS